MLRLSDVVRKLENNEPVFIDEFGMVHCEGCEPEVIEGTIGPEKDLSFLPYPIRGRQVRVYFGDASVSVHIVSLPSEGAAY